MAEPPKHNSSSGRSTAWRLNIRFLLISLAMLAAAFSFLLLWHRQRLHVQSQWFLHQAGRLEAEEKWHLAAAALLHYTRLAPDDVEARIRLAHVYDRSADTPRRRYLATSYYYQAIGLAPHRTDVRQRLAELLLEIGSLAAAETQAQTLLDIEPAHPTGGKVFALCQYHRHRAPAGSAVSRHEVIRAFEHALESNPGDLELSTRLAEMHWNESPQASTPHREKIVGEILDRMVSDNSNDVQARLARYRFRNERGLHDKHGDLDRVIELAPENTEVLSAAGSRALQNGEFASAADYFQRATAANRTDRTLAHAYVGWGESLLAAGKTQEALAAWQSGLEICGRDNVELNARLAGTLIADAKTRQAKDAVARLAQFRQSRPPGTSTLYLARFDALLAQLRAKLAFSSGDTYAGV